MSEALGNPVDLDPSLSHCAVYEAERTTPLVFWPNIFVLFVMFGKSHCVMNNVVAQRLSRFRTLLIIMPWLFAVAALFPYSHTIRVAFVDSDSARLAVHSCGDGGACDVCDNRFFHYPFEQRIIASWLGLLGVAFTVAVVTQQRLASGAVLFLAGVMVFLGLFAAV